MKQQLESPSSGLAALVYLVAALLTAGHAIWHFLMGHYAYILLPVVIALLLIATALVRLANHRARRLTLYLLVSASYILLTVELVRIEHASALWLGLPPVLALLLLPLGAGLLLNLLLAPLWLLLLDVEPGLTQAALTYLTLVVLCALAPWKQLRQHALLRATTAYTPLFQALSISALEECLESELARAQALQRRLSVLVIYLPQLEMAGEQFGPRLYRLMLQRFCQVAQQTCRSHDSLGHAGNSLFWLVLPDTSDNGALMVRNRLLATLEHCVLTETGPLTASIAACTPLPNESYTAFKQRLRRSEQTLMASTS